jgi:hypothetical protein
VRVTTPAPSSSPLAALFRLSLALTVAVAAFGALLLSFRRLWTAGTRPARREPLPDSRHLPHQTATTP